MNDPLIKTVSDTAFMAAAYRAMESKRKDALFRDPLSERLAGKKGEMIVAELPKGAFLGGWHVIIRTRVIDELILSAIANGIDTVLNLGAGLDTRPYRMALPASLRWIEIDQPSVIELKEAKLGDERPRCQLERIKLDLSDLGARHKALEGVTTISRNILVLSEAVVPYLAEDAVASLAADLQACPGIRYWVVDYFSADAYRYRRRTKMASAMKNAPFLFEPLDYFDFFAGLGWHPEEIRYIEEEADKFKRPPPFPFSAKLLRSVLGFFLSEDARGAMKKHSGYVVFKPSKGISST